MRSKPKRHKRTPEQVAAIHAIVRAGYTAVPRLPQAVIAEQAGCNRNYVGQIAHNLGLTDPKYSGKKPDNRLHAVIREGYAQKLPTKVIAEQAGTSRATVRVLASRMKLHRWPDGIAGYWSDQRGYVVSPEHQAEYRHLRKVGLSMHDIGVHFGLLPKERNHQ